MGQIFQPGGAGYFVPTMPQAQRYFTPGQMGQVRPTPRWQAPQGVRQPGQPQTGTYNAINDIKFCNRRHMPYSG